MVNINLDQEAFSLHPKATIKKCVKATAIVVPELCRSEITRNEKQR
jgi:hypothetical protein